MIWALCRRSDSVVTRHGFAPSGPAAAQGPGAPWTETSLTDLEPTLQPKMSPSRILLLTCAALVLMMKQMKADDSCSSGPCIVGLTGAEPSAITSFTSSSFTPLLTAVGCLNLVAIRFQIRKTLSRAPLSVSFCQRQPTGLCLDKGTGGGDDWIKSEDFARICCSMHPKDRDAAASTLLGKPASSMATCKGYGSNGYYDMYTCATLQIGQSANDTTYETLASVAFVPPFGSDLSTSGQTELCFQVYDDQRTPRPPTCLKIQVIASVSPLICF